MIHPPSSAYPLESNGNNKNIDGKNDYDNSNDNDNDNGFEDIQSFWKKIDNATFSCATVSYDR